MAFYRLFSGDPILIIPWITALVLSITIHEFAHGFAAFKLGDNTAEMSGRLTLNPLAHLDPLGTIMLFLVGFGWAKPVPINPYLIQKGRLGSAIVSFAGIGMNLLFAISSVLGLHILLSVIGLDPTNVAVRFLAFIVFINIGLFIFNLVPIAPLDGYRIFESIAPFSFRRIAPFFETWGFVILIAVVFFTNIISYLITFAIYIFSITSGLDLLSLAFGGL
ncbi:MAG: site-2 protease family protein [bacterium]|nr:site-2 protease family protein [bacterium]